jgi:uncharacterized protein YxjI
MSAPSSTPPGWYPDPSQRHQQRYFDGNAWTEHVSDHGVASVDVLQPAAPQTAANTAGQVANVLTAGFGDRTPDQIQHQVAAQTRHGNAANWQGDGTVLNEPILVVNQKAKIFEMDSQYSIYNSDGAQIAAVHQVGQSQAKKAMRLLTNMDNFMTHKFELSDPHGNVLLRITRPAKMIKSKLQVTTGGGQEIGYIVQQNMVGKIRFGLESGGSTYGAINAENWRAWDFHIADHTGRQVGRITKTWEGLATAMFTTADNYVIHIYEQLQSPLRELVVAAAVSVDTALKQNEAGSIF